MQANTIWENYLNDKTCIDWSTQLDAPLAGLDEVLESKVIAYRQKEKYYNQLDRSVLLSMLATQQALSECTWQADENIGINIGSSRGATHVFEQKYQHFSKIGHLKDEVLSSPMTTLGNISSWTARDADLNGLAFSHSLTCSTSFHSILNSVAWLKAGMLDKIVVGGTEAPLTDFTIAQMQALRIYASAKDSIFPCQAMNLDKQKNGMVLGEGAAVFGLEKNPKKPLAWIKGIGFATEKISHPTSISKNGECLYQSMKMAIKDLDKEEIDIIITHAPGTIRGDQAEANAIKRVFGKKIPSLTNNKWKIGHTLGASGALSLEMALFMILHQHFIAIPYLADSNENQKSRPLKINHILINTVGFGGTAVSLLISK